MTKYALNCAGVCYTRHAKILLQSLNRLIQERGSDMFISKWPTSTALLRFYSGILGFEFDTGVSAKTRLSSRRAATITISG